MKRIAMTIALCLTPGALLAQHAPVTTQHEATAHATGMSAQASAQLHAILLDVHSKGLPESPIEERVAEGRAKGASDAQIVAAALKMERHLEDAHDALRAAGQNHPRVETIVVAARAFEHGATAAHIATLVHQTTASAGLTLAIEALSQQAAESNQEAAGSNEHNTASGAHPNEHSTTTTAHPEPTPAGTPPVSTNNHGTTTTVDHHPVSTTDHGTTTTGTVHPMPPHPAPSTTQTHVVTTTGVHIVVTPHKHP